MLLNSEEARASMPHTLRAYGYAATYAVKLQKITLIVSSLLQS